MLMLKTKADAAARDKVFRFVLKQFALTHVKELREVH
jgi:hypothetical protein